MVSNKVLSILSLFSLAGGIQLKDNFERFKIAKKVAVLTGASSPIGIAIAIELLKENIVVVGIDDSVDRLKQIVSNELPENMFDANKFHTKKCDITDETELLSVFKWIRNNFDGIGIMINNAERVIKSSLLSGKTSDWEQTMYVNVVALSACTREAFRSMTDHEFQGHIIHINSTAGHSILGNYGFQMYNASKVALTILTDSIRHELQLNKSKVKVTSVSPKFIEPGTSANDDLYRPLEPEKVAEVVMFAINTPPELLIAELTVVPAGATIQDHNDFQAPVVDTVLEAPVVDTDLQAFVFDIENL